jgi:hypothetical protein
MVSVEQIICERSTDDNICIEVRSNNGGMQRIIQYRNVSLCSSFSTVIVTKSRRDTKYTQTSLKHHRDSLMIS